MPGTPDTLPSGKWNFGPIELDWDLKDLNEVDASISVGGLDIDDLKGTLNNNCLSLESDIRILSFQGKIALSAQYAGNPATDGLWIKGQITGPGIDTGAMNYRIIHW